MFVGGLFWIVVLVALVVLVVRVLPGLGAGAPRAGRAEAILKERYARGEIDRETYVLERDKWEVRGRAHHGAVLGGRRQDQPSANLAL